MINRKLQVALIGVLLSLSATAHGQASNSFLIRWSEATMANISPRVGPSVPLAPVFVPGQPPQLGLGPSNPPPTTRPQAPRSAGQIVSSTGTAVPTRTEQQLAVVSTLLVANNPDSFDPIAKEIIKDDIIAGSPNQ